MTLKNETSKTFATIIKQGEKEFAVIFGYYTEFNIAYGNEVATDRKFYKSEVMALKKANEYLSK